MSRRKLTCPLAEASSSRTFLSRISPACALLIIILWAAICGTSPASAQTPNIQYNNKAVDIGGRGDLRVNPTTLALELKIPLGSYPGRAGLNLPVTLSYSSKLWRMNYNSFNPGGFTSSGAPLNNGYTRVVAVYGEHSSAGWTSGLGFPSFDNAPIQFYDIDGRPEGTGSCRYCYTIDRVLVWMPDGSSHELRSTDQPRPPGSPSLDDLYAVDGSRMRYHRPSQTLFMPDGARYLFATSQYVDRNGNTLTYTGGGWTDTLGRAISAPPLTGNVNGTTGSFPYSLPGMSGQYVFVWKRLGDPGVLTTAQPLKYTADSGCPLGTGSYTPRLFQSDVFNTRTCIQNAGSVFNPVVLTQIQMPSGQSYTFTYNTYGEIDRVQLPTGGYERYEYAQVPALGSMDIPYSQANRGVVNRYVSPSGSGADEQAWHYEGGALVKITAPDNTLVERYLHTEPKSNLWGYTHESARAGMAYDERYYTAPEAGVRRMLRRKLTEWATTGSNAVGLTGVQNANRNARMTKEVEILLDTGGDALARTTTYGYDLTYEFSTGANQTSVNEFAYGFVSQGTGQTGGIGSMPAPSQLLRITETNYLDSILSYRSLNILGLRTSVVVKNGAGAPATKTVMSYDEPVYQLVNNYGAVTGWSNPGAVRGNPTTVRSYVDASASVPANQSCPAGVCVDTHAQYDQCGSVVSAWDGKDFVTQAAYSPVYAYAYPTSVTTPAPDPNNTGYGSTTGLVTSAAYDFNTGLVTSITDPNNQTTSFDYSDPLNRLKAEVRPQGGGRTDYFYSDTPGNLYVQTLTDLDATRRAETKQYFDGLGRPRRKATYENSDPSKPWIIVDTEYNALGFVKRTSMPYRAAEGAAAFSTDRWTENTYDALGRLLRETTRPDNASSVTDYSGDRVLVKDQAGKERISRSDALGMMTDVWEVTAQDSATVGITPFPGHPEAAYGYQTSYAYDAVGNLRRVTQGEQSRFFKYDALGRLTRAKYPEQAVNASITGTDPVTNNSQWSMSFDYDENGNVVSRTDARGVVVNYGYDGLNRNTTVRYVDAVLGVGNHTKDIDRHYDGAVNGRGRFYYFNWDPNDNTKYDTHLAIDEYDELGRPKKYRQHFQVNGVFSPQFTVTRTYDLAGNVKTQTYPSGHTVAYSYDLAARPDSFTGNLGDGVARSYATEITYSEFGSVARERFGTQAPLYHKLRYNPRGQTYDVRLSTGADADSWNRGLLVNHYGGGDLNTAWGTSGPDNNGNVLRSHHYVPNTDAADLNNPATHTIFFQDYEYDQLDRLTKVTETNSVNWQTQYVQKYDYDRWGNRTINQGLTWGVPEPQFELRPQTNWEVPEPSNRLYAPGDSARAPGQKLMRYDFAGNLVHDTHTGAGARVYDAENRMTGSAVDVNGNWSFYGYDADGRRVKRKIANEEWWQIYGIDGELLAEYRAGAAPFVPSKEYGYRGGELLVTMSSGDDQRLRRFVYNLYYGALRRDPTSQELTDRVNELTAAGAQGQTQLYTAAAQRARDLFASTNYGLATGRTAQQFVADLYYTYLQRAPDDSGLNWWAGQAGDTQQGRINALNGFEASAEFQTVTSTLYGAAVSDDQRTERLVNAFYLAAYGRFATASELQQQRDALHAAAALGPDQVKAQAEAMGRGLFAAQVSDLSLPAQQFVTNLYEGFLQRGPDAGGLGFWTAQAGNTAQSRQNVLDAFAVSDPFRELAGTLCRETLWLVADPLGTPRMVADKSGSLAGMKRHDYLPFGEELFPNAGGRTAAQGYGAVDNVRQKFTGYERDAETELDYARARYYSFKQGRYVSVDPALDSGDPTAPQSWNRYSYALNNPFKYTDPCGTNVICKVGDREIPCNKFAEMLGNGEFSVVQIVYKGQVLKTFKASEFTKTTSEQTEEGLVTTTTFDRSAFTKAIQGFIDTLQQAADTEEIQMPSRSLGGAGDMSGGGAGGKFEAPADSQIRNVYKSIKDAPDYPQGFRAAQNGTKKVTVRNRELLSDLRKVAPGEWKKVYKDGYDGNGNKVSVHYHQHTATGKVFNVKTVSGWSNR